MGQPASKGGPRGWEAPSLLGSVARGWLCLSPSATGAWLQPLHVFPRACHHRPACLTPAHEATNRLPAPSSSSVTWLIFVPPAPGSGPACLLTLTPYPKCCPRLRISASAHGSPTIPIARRALHLTLRSFICTLHLATPIIHYRGRLVTSPHAPPGQAAPKAPHPFSSLV